MQITFRESYTVLTAQESVQHVYPVHKWKRPLPTTTLNGRYLNLVFYGLSPEMKMQEMLPSVTTMKCYHFQGKTTPVYEGTSKISTLIQCNPSNRNQFKAPLMKHKAEENMVCSTVHNINIYIKHIILLLL